MDKLSFNDEIEFNENHVISKVIVETSFSKEIRILLKSGQVMKEHKTPFPIIIHIIQGNLKLGVQSEMYDMKDGDIIALDGNIPHNLIAVEDSIVRLTLSKHDKVERVKSVLEN
jgi:quercetin dioxygenase-like cupin family protein